ncbi:Starch-binding associating with outer membrane [Chitinophaga costaii]|uniref:Starch-binding associating with outer membrane n=1 Tax=Chitinophaga costaii TaxID=1335309 RepID=A0A1C4DGK3_9BACT|nr:RagB/SusD family nutrient uptake outer membrane protein [Chitinophaga costaii]PUZ24623.1 RagB/SusD family nutrient uptake outer membrane protein [Chitinophaga costaii]SCC30456.1 Starch-binding associating with outer membrane [Chitinophaga costaii]
MKKLFLYSACAALIVAAVTGATSCKKILDQEPYNSTYTGAYFKTELDAKTANAGAYALLRKALLNDMSWHTYGDIPSGELVCDNDAWHSAITSGQFTGLNVQSHNWNWQQYYQILQQINLIITKVPDIDEGLFNSESKNHIIGEGYFLRAYVYFYMSRIWGDVPLKLEPDLDVTTVKNIPRSPADSVLDQCLADVAKAESLLDWGYTDESQRAVRANKGSAYALEAHIRAWRHDYAGSEKAADQVITQGGYSLLDSMNYKKVFIGKSMEGIFEINISDAQSEGIAIYDYDGNLNQAGYTMKDPYITNKDGLQWWTNTDYINTLWDNSDTLNDVRYRDFFHFPKLENNGQIIKYSNIAYVSSSNMILSNNLPIFRLADIMLLRAEALVALGRKSEALPLLNAVRERAGLDDKLISDDLETIVLEERLRELYFEGQSYYDLVRTKKITVYNQHFPSEQFSNGDPSGGWLWPVDPNMFKDDPTLVQTPYWRGKL